MIKICLKNLEFYSFHGYYDWERENGNIFWVDIELEIKNTGKPCGDLNRCFNYEIAYQICKNKMQEKYILLEDLLHDIGCDLVSSSELIHCVRVCIKKQQPSFGSKIEYVSLESVFYPS